MDCMRNFQQKIIGEAEQIPEEVSESELSTRELLFDKKIFTIDGIDAKDLDDAVSLEKINNGHYLLGVHIADVSHYVQPSSLLDRESLSSRDKCLSGGSGDSNAAQTTTLQRNLFFERRGSSAYDVLLYGN